MWSDRLPEKRRRRLVERLRSVLPAPASPSRGATTPLRLPPGRSAVRPEAVAEALRTEPGFAWLDGGPDGHRLFSRPIAVLSVRSGRATVSGPGGTAGLRAGGFDLLEAAFASWAGPGKAFLVGYLGYELAAELEALSPSPAALKDDLFLPDLHLALFDSALRWDGQAWTLESTDAWRHVGGRPDAVREAERKLTAARSIEVPHGAPAGHLAGRGVRSRPGRPGFEIAVARAVERIRAGDIFQVNLCRRLEARLASTEVWPLWQRLRAASPADHGAFLDLGRQRAVLSVSPELFLAVRNGAVETRPIKGTRPRGATPRDDRALARELAESEKDRAELAMIVDVARNDLGRVCLPGTIEVPRHAEVVTLPTLHHTVSTVTGRLAGGGPDASLELLRAAFPPASITGAPKIRAVTVAAAEEERRRGPAMGALGWISLGGDMELAVAIRTAVAARGRIAYHAGCGIVVDSDPELEYAESAVKAQAFLTALGAAEST